MSSKKAKLLENARKNLLKGQYDRAADEYRQIIQLDPSDIRHRQKLAEILTKANQKEEAVKEYNFLAKHYIDSVHYLKAIAVYKQIQKLDVSNPETSLTLASLNEKQGLIGNAIAEYASAVLIYEKNDENRKALKTLISMLALDPGNSAVRIRIAEKYFTTGSEDKSLNEFESLLQDLNERDDENGFRLVSERALNLFGDSFKELINKLSNKQTEDVQPAESSPLTLPKEKSIPTIENLSVNSSPVITVLDVSSDTDLATNGSDSILNKDIKPIEAIIPIDEIKNLPEKPCSTGSEDEWEEEIDLADFNAELPLTTGLNSSQNKTEGFDIVGELEELELEELELEELELELEELELEELELEELELEELELELEINDEPRSSSEPLALLEASPLQAVETFDLGQELSFFADEIEFDLSRIDATGTSFDITSNSGLKKSELENEDVESHYSLGLAYKEMGLFDEAIAEFIVASRSVNRRIDCLILQGVCFREMGNLNKAVEILSNILLDKSVTEDEYLGLQYELALCYETSGEFARAKKLLTDISRVRPAFSDVAAHLKKMQN